MHKFDVLVEADYRYIHSRETGALVATLVMERSANHRITGKFVEEDGEDEPRGRTLREWKAILSRRFKKLEAA